MSHMANTHNHPPTHTHTHTSTQTDTLTPAAGEDNYKFLARIYPPLRPLVKCLLSDVNKNARIASGICQ